LPLWSISLLNHREAVDIFLEDVFSHAGRVQERTVSDETGIAALAAEDITVLVCCYGFGASTAEQLTGILERHTVPILDLSTMDLRGSLNRLRCSGMMAEHGVTEMGVSYLKASKHWVFADYLKENAIL
jgi:hypothetical protein